jgi:hypothetical protein
VSNPPAPAVVPAPGFVPGPAVLKKELPIKLAYGSMDVPAGAEIKLISKSGDQWFAQWNSMSFLVDESYLQPK